MSSAEANFTPGRLWSLWDIMQPFDASGFIALSSALSAFGIETHEDRQALSDATKKDFADRIVSYEVTFIALGWSASLASYRRLMAKLKDDSICRWADIGPICEELRVRLVDESKGKNFFSLSLRETEFYRRPKIGWEKGISRFPAILDDVEEASKCFALSRYGAAIFHSMQIVEHGLIELGAFIGVNDPMSGWTAVSSKLSNILKTKYRDRSEFERANHAFLEQMQGTVEGLKNAWRNKISHAEGRLVLMSKEFSPEIAEEILLASRAFIRRLAEGLPAAL